MFSYNDKAESGSRADPPQPTRHLACASALGGSVKGPRMDVATAKETRRELAFDFQMHFSGVHLVCCSPKVPSLVDGVLTQQSPRQ